MNGPSIRLNDRKRFVFAAAMAAVFLLLAGGTSALANTVWCVTKTGVYPYSTCTKATTFSTISAALLAPPAPQDVIVVGPGTYNESVSITIPNLSLLGAQAGRDARVDRHDSAKESIVDATGQGGGPGGGAAFYVVARNVVIDGFTIQGGSGGTNGAGIYVSSAAAFPTAILNNIIQNNAVGVFLNLGQLVLIKNNLFKTNNAGEAGSSEIDFAGMAGFGIAGYGGDEGTAITDNAFEGNLAAAMALYGGTFVEVTKNTSKNDGSFLVFTGGGVSFIRHNQGQDFGAKGFLPIPRTSPPGGYADAAIDVGNGSAGLEINDNDLEEGKTPGYNGIGFSAIFGVTPSAFNQVSGNSIKRFAGNGIVAEASSGTGMLAQSEILGNDLEDNGNDGILIEAAATSGNLSNSLLHNQAEGNRNLDCEDDTNGSTLSPPVTGTLGTANTWFNNIGSSSLPAGLCAPGRGH